MNPLTILYFNALLFSGLFLYCYFIRKCGSLAKLSSFVYALLACCAAFFASFGAYHYYLGGLKTWPFLLYFVLFFIMIFPFIKSNKMIDKFVIRDTKRANTISDVYLFFCAIQIVLTGQKGINSIVTGDYMSLYLNRVDEGVDFYYSNIYEQAIINVVNYFFVPMVLYAFYVFARHVDYKRKNLLMVIPFITLSLIAISSASRTSFFYIILIYATAFFMYKDFLKKKLRKSIIVVGLVFVGVSILGSYAITASRFANDEEGDWVSNYFGMSVITAHDTFAYTTRYSDGTYFFRNVLSVMGKKYTPTHCTVDHGYGFRPMISTRFSDFGPTECIVYVVFCMLLFSYLLSKRNYSWGLMYIIAYYYKCLTLGAFYENSVDISWLYVLIVSFILNALTNNKKNGKNNIILSPTISSHAS